MKKSIMPVEFEHVNGRIEVVHATTLDGCWYCLERHLLIDDRYMTSSGGYHSILPYRTVSEWRREG